MATNRTYDEINVGDSAEITHTCSTRDLLTFAHASGNHNPLHLPASETSRDGSNGQSTASSMWIGALISAVLGNNLPGPGTRYKSQSLDFFKDVTVGDQVTIKLKVTEKKPDGVLGFEVSVVFADGTQAASGQAEVIAPQNKIEASSASMPALLIERYGHFDRLLGLTETLSPLPTAVVAPDDASSLEGALMAEEKGLIEPILIGSKARMEATATDIGRNLSGKTIIDTNSGDEAAAKAVSLVHEGAARAVMKGHLHTDDLLRHIVKRDGGLRTKKRISHVFVMDVPGRSTPILIGDAVINISPDLNTKVDITQNAINAALALGIEKPKVAILSAIETINPAIPSSLDAAALSKMAERGQISGGIVDGPLAMDNAVDAQAARTKGITSPVAGHAEVLITPNLESGNMLAKELTFIAHAEAAGLVIGAKVPVMLTSRADNSRARLASCAIALLYDHWQRTGAPVEIFQQVEN